MGTAAVETVVVAIVAVVDNRSEVACSWAAVAIVAVDIVNMGLAVLASCIPLTT